MKKLIVLFAILAMVNVASAGIVDIQISSLNGNPITPTREITITPSDTVNMDIIYKSTTGMYLFALSVDAFMDTYAWGTFDAATSKETLTWSSYWDLIGNMSGGRLNLGPTPEAGSATIWASSASAQGVPAVTGNWIVAVDHLLWHCTADLTYPNTTVIKLVLNDLDPPEGTPAGDTFEVNGSGAITFINDYGTGVIIHNIPEPMTLTLLGLGSLFLARRKK